MPITTREERLINRVHADLSQQGVKTKVHFEDVDPEPGHQGYVDTVKIMFEHVYFISSMYRMRKTAQINLFFMFIFHTVIRKYVH